MESKKIEINFIHTGVGDITESDVMLASTSEAIVVGFQVKADSKISELARHENIPLRLYEVIYEAIDEIRQAMEERLDPLKREVVTGSAEVRATFASSKLGTIAGCYVLDGSISRNNKVKLLRNDEIIWEGQIGSMRRLKDEVNEVKAGLECGINLKYNDVLFGDIIKAYTIEEVPQTL